MITQIRHTGIVVADLEAALRFWRDLLGFKVARRMDEAGPHIDAIMELDGVRVTTVKLAAPDGHLIELLHFHSHPDKPAWEGTPHSTGLTHLALTDTDLEDTWRRLSAAGITFNAPPQTSPDGRAKLTYCRGPEGILLELVEMLQP